MFFKSDDTDKKEEETSSAGIPVQRRSAARAKPARAAAGSVREASAGDAMLGHKASKKEETAARLRARKEKETRRVDESRVNEVSDILLRRNDDYRRVRKVWWISLAVTLACTVLTLVVSQLVSTSGDEVTSGTGVIVSTVCLVLAYAAVIFSLVWDWVKVRPYRNAMRQKASSMSDKAQDRVLEEARLAELQRKQAKQAKKSKGKKAGESTKVSEVSEADAADDGDEAANETKKG